MTSVQEHSWRNFAHHVRASIEECPELVGGGDTQRCGPDDPRHNDGFAGAPHEIADPDTFANLFQFGDTLHKDFRDAERIGCFVEAHRIPLNCALVGLLDAVPLHSKLNFQNIQEVKLASHRRERGNR